MQRTQTYRIWILSFLFIALLAGCSKGCGNKSGDKKTDELLNFIPADKSYLVGIDWKRVRESKWGPTLIKNIPPQAQTFSNDIERVVAGFNLNLKQPTASQDFVAIVKGKIDQAAWLAQMSQTQDPANPPKTEEYRGVPIHFYTLGRDLGITFLKDYAFFGTKESLFKAIDLAQNSGSSVLSNKPLMEVIQNLNQSKMIWAGGLIPEGAIPSGLPGGGLNPINTLVNVTAFDLGVDFPQELTFDLNLTAKSPEAANQISGALNFSKTGASMFQRNPATNQVWNNLNIAAKDNRVLIHLKLEENTLKEISDAVPQAGAPAAPPAEGSVPTPQPQEAPIAP